VCVCVCVGVCIWRELINKTKLKYLIKLFKVNIKAVTLWDPKYLHTNFAYLQNICVEILIVFRENQ